MLVAGGGSNRGPVNSSMSSSNGVSGVGGGEVARPDPAAFCWSVCGQMGSMDYGEKRMKGQGVE